MSVRGVLAREGLRVCAVRGRPRAARTPWTARRPGGGAARLVAVSGAMGLSCGVIVPPLHFTKQRKPFLVAPGRPFAPALHPQRGGQRRPGVGLFTATSHESPEPGVWPWVRVCARGLRPLLEAGARVYNHRDGCVFTLEAVFRG